MRPGPRILLASAALAAAGAGGYVGYRLLGSETPQAVTALPDRGGDEIGTAEAPAETMRGRRAIPERLPEFTLVDREGVPRQLSHWAGRPLLVNFWATWCAPCRREIPLLMKLRAERQAQQLEVIGIAVDFRDAVLEYARDIGIDYPLLIGEQDGLEAAAAFGMDLLLPFTVFSDRSGRIVTVKVGELHADEADYILDTVRGIDAGRISVEEGRDAIAAELKRLATGRAIQAPSTP